MYLYYKLGAYQILPHYQLVSLSSILNPPNVFSPPATLKPCPGRHCHFGWCTSLTFLAISHLPQLMLQIPDSLYILFSMLACCCQILQKWGKWRDPLYLLGCAEFRLFILLLGLVMSCVGIFEAGMLQVIPVRIMESQDKQTCISMHYVVSLGPYWYWLSKMVKRLCLRCMGV